ncbi:MAG: hypothetical protein ACR2LQ_12375 [Acidimicrobiales bacterium]
MKRSLREQPAAPRVIGAVIVIVLCIGIATAVARNGGDKIGGAGRLDTSGHALVTRADGTAFTVSGSTTLHDGDVAEAQEGTITLELPGGAKLEGLPGSDRGEPTKLKAGRVVELIGGDLLVTSSHPTHVDAADNHVTIEPPSSGAAAVRMGRSLAVSVRAYRGSALIDSAGQERRIPTLRQIEVAVLGQPPARPRPLSVERPDSWDLRFLGEAIELGTALQSLSSAYSPTLRADEGRTAGFYENVLPLLRNVKGFDEAFSSSSPKRPQGEILVGAAIVALGRDGDAAARWSSVFAFRDDGAAWGIVALDQGVSTGPLLEAVKAAIDHTTFEFAAATPTPPAGPAPTATPPSPTPGPNAPASPVGNSAPSGPSQQGPTTPPAPAPAPPLLPPIDLPPVTVPPPEGSGSGLIPDLANTVGQLLGGLFGRGG